MADTKKRLPRGRIRAAIAVLLGRQMTIDQINREWAEIQSESAEMFNKFNALASRLAKAERAATKKSIEALVPDETPPEFDVPPDAAARKAALRKRAFDLRMRGPANVNGDQGGEV